MEHPVFAPIFQALPDILQAIALHLNPKQASMLSETNSFCRSHVRPMETRYEEAIRAWPWMSEPQRIRTHCFSTGWDATKMFWCFGDNCLVVTAETSHAGTQSFTLPMHPEQEEDFSNTLYPSAHDVHNDPQYVDVFQAADAYDTRPLVINSAIREPRPHETVSQVWYTPDVMFVTNRPRNHNARQAMELSIIRYDSYTLLRHIRHLAAVNPPVLFRQGELWVVNNDTAEILYYGPHVDKLLNCNISGRVWSAHLHAACARIATAIEILTRRHDSMDTRFDQNETILLTLSRVAAPHRHYADLKQQVHDLRTHGADFNASNTSNVTALEWAFIHESADMVRLLLDNGAAMNPRGINDLIRRAGDSRHPMRCFNAIDALMEHRADINYTDRTQISPLMVAVTTLNLEAVEFLLAKGADPFQKFEGSTARDMLFDTDWSPPLLYMEGDESDGYQIARVLDRVMGI